MFLREDLKRAIFIKTCQMLYATIDKNEKGHQYMGDITLTQKILSFIEDNLDKKLSLERIAKEFSYSKYYIAREFKANTGMTVYKYIQGRRLDESARKLAETCRPIVEIALEAGYGSQQAFTQAFRRIYACTPQEYRRIGVFIPKQRRIRMRFVLAGVTGGRMAA